MYNDARRKVRTHTQMHDRRQWQSPSNGAASVASRCWDNPSPKKARARCGSAGLADGDDHCVLHEIKHDLGEANGPTVNSEINDYLLEALHCLILNIVLHVAATVLYKDHRLSDFGTGDLQVVTYQLCHMYASAERAVSYASLAYLADHSAERGKLYLYSSKGSIVAEKLQVASSMLSLSGW